MTTTDARRDDAGTDVELLDLLPVAVVRLDPTGAVVRVNRALLQLLGRTDLADHPEHLTGRRLAELARLVEGIAADDAAELLARMARLAAVAGDRPAGAPAPEGELLELRYEDGRRLHLRVRADRLGGPAGGPGGGLGGGPGGGLAGGLVVVLTDVTAEHRLEDEALAQDERYHLLADHVGDVVLVHRGSRVEWASPSVVPVLGLRPEELVGHELEEFAHPDDVQDLRTLVPGGPARQHRLRLRHPEGTGGYRWFTATITGRRDGDALAEVFVALHDIEEQVAAEEVAAHTEHRLRLVFDASTDGYAVYEAVRGPDGAVTRLILTSMNAAGLETVGLGAGEAHGKEVFELVPASIAADVRREMLAVLDGAGALRGRHVVTTPDGDRVLDGVVTLLDTDLVLTTWRDVTDAVEGERLLERAYEETAEMRATLQTALDATSDGFAVYSLEWDDHRALTGLRVVHANAAGAQSLGLDPNDLVGLELHEFLPDVEGMGLWDRIVDAALTKAPQQIRIHVFSDGVTGPGSGGGGEWQSSWDYAVAPVGEERMAITWRDVSAEEGALRQLARHRDEAMHSATHDALTGLPNRTLLLDHLRAALITCRTGERVGVVFVDLDHFKAINDTHGHAAGDAVLRATAERLGRLVRHGDLAARLAGDEFVLVLTQLSAEWTPDQFFARASVLLAEPLVAEGVELHPSASLGVVLANPAAGPVDVDTLIKSADAAMYEAKAVRRRP